MHSNFEKNQEKILHKSAGSARIKKYFDKQQMIWKAKLLAPAQKNNYSQLGTQNSKKGLQFHKKGTGKLIQPYSLSFIAKLVGICQVTFRPMAKSKQDYEQCSSGAQVTCPSHACIKLVTAVTGVF